MQPHFKQLVTAVLLLIPGFAYAQLDFADPIYLENTISNPTSLASGDFNGDGKTDLAYWNRGMTSTELYFLINKGTGVGANAYEDSAPMAVDMDILSYGYFKVADLNNDHKDDIAIFAINIPPPYDHYEIKVQLYISNGDHHALKEFPIDLSAPGYYTFQMEVTDFGSDGRLDLILPNYSGPALVIFNTGAGVGPDLIFFSNELGSIPGLLRYTNIGRGPEPIVFGGGWIMFYTYGLTFLGPYYQINTGDNIVDYRVQDFNADGFADILVLLDNTPWHLELYMNNGDGTFDTNPIHLGMVSPNSTMDVNDFNLDGRPDILTDSPADPYISVTQNGATGFGTWTINKKGTGQSIGAVFADMNGDNTLEVAELQKSDIVLYNPFFDIPISALASDGKIVDIDADGHNDIVSGSPSSGAITIRRGKGDFQFYEPTYLTYHTDGVYDTRIIEDFNGDSFIDIFYSNGKNSGIMYSDHGTLMPPVAVAPLLPDIGQKVIAADFNNDGKLDLYTNKYTLLVNNVGQFISSPNSYTDDNSSLSSGDFNNDNFQDVLLTSNGKVVIGYNNGLGSFSSYTEVPGIDGISLAAVTHFRFDFIPDIISMNGQTSNEFYLTYNNNGTFATMTFPCPAGQFVGLPYQKDLDGDGLPEFIAAINSFGLPGFMVFKKNDMGSLDEIGRSYAESGGSIPAGVAVGDLNGDTVHDVVLFNTNTSSTIAIFPAIGRPTIQARNLQVTNLGKTEVTLTLEKGDGNGRIIFLSQFPYSNNPPNDGQWYVSDPYVQVIMGDIDQTTVTNLPEGTQYTAVAYEYTTSSDNTYIRYLRDSPASVSFKTKVTPKQQTITSVWLSPDNPMEGDDQAYLSVITDSYLSVIFEVISGNVTLVDYDKLINLHPGPVKIKATQPGNDEYLPAEPKELSFCVIPTAPYVFPVDGHNEILTTTSATNNQWILNGEDIPGATGVTYTPLVAGNYSVRVDYSGCNNTSNVWAFVMQPPHPPTLPPSNLQAYNIGTDRVSIAVQKGNGSGRLIIIQDAANAYFVPNQNQFYDGDIPPSTWIESGDNDHVTLSGLNEGTNYVALVYEYQESADGQRITYLISERAEKTFKTAWTPHDQTITFDSPGDKTENSGLFELEASASSGLPVVFDVISGNATIDGNWITINGPGPVKIRALQAGDDKYVYAEKTVTFCVNPSTPDISTTIVDHVTTYVSSSDTNNHWLLNGEEIPDATDNTYAPVADGNYSVMVSYGTCSSTSSEKEYLVPPTDEPTQAPSNLQANNISQTDATLSLTKGNGNGRIIITRKSSVSELIPADNSVISSSATAIVRTGDINGTTLTNLDPGTDYIATAYEYFTAPGEINYLISAKAEVSFTTLPEVVNGIEEPTDQIVLYPNPATMFVAIDGAPGIDNVTFIDILGREHKMQVHSNTVDVSKLGRGYYIVNIQTTYGPVKRRLLIK